MFRKSRILIGLMGVWSLSLLLFSGYTRAQKMTFSAPETWMGHSGAVTALAFHRMVRPSFPAARIIS